DEEASLAILIGVADIELTTRTSTTPRDTIDVPTMSAIEPRVDHVEARDNAVANTNSIIPELLNSHTIHVDVVRRVLCCSSNADSITSTRSRTINRDVLNVDPHNVCAKKAMSIRVHLLDF